MLDDGRVAVPDWPVPPGYMDTWVNMARVFEEAIALGYSDSEAWEELFDDEDRLRFYRAVYGNKPQRKRKRAPDA